jgi:hypothetical protein
VCNDSGDTNPDVDSNRRILLKSAGYGINGAAASIEAIFSATDLPAVLVESNLKISGNPDIVGLGGAAHSNGTLDFDGTPCAEQYYSSASSIVDPERGSTGTCPGGTYNAGNVRSNQSRITVPAIAPASFEADATYKLLVESGIGVIRDQAGVDVTASVLGWSYSSGVWMVSGGSMTEGTYYSTQNVRISGSPDAGGNGQNVIPLAVTLISAKYIDISGNPTFTPHLTKNGVNYAMIAGTDLRLGGNATTALVADGVHYAGHQIGFSGNPTIYGQVLAADLGDITSGDDKLIDRGADGYMSISGNPTIRYTGGSGLAVGMIRGWRELRQ